VIAEVPPLFNPGLRSSIVFYGSRFEATQQNESVPIILIHPESHGNVLDNTLVGHSYIEADFHTNPNLVAGSGKFISYKDGNTNEVLNPSFKTSPLAGVCGYVFQGCTAEVSSSFAGLYTNAGVLRVDVAAGAVGLVKIELSHTGAQQAIAQFGVFVHTDNSNPLVFATLTGINGVQTSRAANPGNWSFIGLLVNKPVGAVLPTVRVNLQRIV